METSDQQLGVDIVRKALRTPLSTIAKNAGADSSIVVQKVMSSENPNEGYDALKDIYVDMIHEGVIVCACMCAYVGGQPSAVFSQGVIVCVCMCAYVGGQPSAVFSHFKIFISHTLVDIIVL